MELQDSKAIVIVVPVSSSGILTRLGAEFRELYPDLKTAYAHACRSGYVDPGQCWFWQAPDDTILCMLGIKKEFDDIPCVGDVFEALHRLAGWQKEFGLSMALPPVGCGTGELSWIHDVKPFILSQFNMDLTTLCFKMDPQGL